MSNQPGETERCLAALRRGDADALAAPSRANWAVVLSPRAAKATRALNDAPNVRRFVVIS